MFTELLKSVHLSYYYFFKYILPAPLSHSSPDTPTTHALYILPLSHRALFVFLLLFSCCSSERVISIDIIKLTESFFISIFCQTYPMNTLFQMFWSSLNFYLIFFYFSTETFYPFIASIFFFLKNFLVIYFFRERGEGRETEKERNINVSLLMKHWSGRTNMAA